MIDSASVFRFVMRHALRKEPLCKRNGASRPVSSFDKQPEKPEGSRPAANKTNPNGANVDGIGRCLGLRFGRQLFDHTLPPQLLMHFNERFSSYLVGFRKIVLDVNGTRRPNRA